MEKKEDKKEKIEEISPEHSVGTCGHTSNGEFVVTDDIKTKCVLCGQYYKV